MKKTIETDQFTCIKYMGIFREITYEISEHNFNEHSSSTPSIWCTYIILSEEKHEDLKGRLNDAPWNYGQTYYRKEQQQFVDLTEDSPLKDKWEKPYYKIGDDFSHLWDMQRYSLYSKEYMETHIKEIIDFLLGEGSCEKE